MGAIPDDLVRGDLLKIVWADIYEDATGDPHKAKLARRTSYGLFWSRGVDDALPVLVTTTTLDDQDGQNGYCIYPEACIRELKVVKRVRRPKKAQIEDGVGRP